MLWKRPGRYEKPRCSFCAKAGDLAGELIPSPLNNSPQIRPVYICPDCVEVCKSIVDDRPPAVKVSRVPRRIITVTEEGSFDLETLRDRDTKR